MNHINAAAPPILELRGVGRRFGGLVAVSGMAFTLAAGECLAIIGPNGAGKTTLFNLISGHDVPTEGAICLDGTPIAGRSPERIAALGLARTFQHGRVFANLSVRDNVLVGAHRRLRAVRPHVPGFGALAELALALLRPAAVRREEAALHREVEAILGLFGDRLLPRLEQPAHALSYANRRRLEIARALALRPRVLLLDEPTAGMNETETAELRDVIAGLKRGGQTILLIEHKLDLVTRLSDRMIVMDHGARIAEGPPAGVARDPVVIAAYLGRGTATGPPGIRSRP